MESNKPKLPKKGGGEVLKKLYENHRKNSKPSPALEKVIKQQIVDEAERNKKSARPKDLDV